MIVNSTLHSWPWPRAFLFLTSRKVCLRKGCPWPRIFFVSLALASSLVSSVPPLTSFLLHCLTLEAHMGQFTLFALFFLNKQNILDIVGWDVLTFICFGYYTPQISNIKIRQKFVEFFPIDLTATCLYKDSKTCSSSTPIWWILCRLMLNICHKHSENTFQTSDQLVPIFVEHWGDNLQFYPNFSLFSTLGGMNLDHDFVHVWKFSEDQRNKCKWNTFSPRIQVKTKKKKVFIKNRTLFLPEFRWRPRK